MATKTKFYLTDELPDVVRDWLRDSLSEKHLKDADELGGWRKTKTGYSCVLDWERSAEVIVRGGWPVKIIIHSSDKF